MSWIKICLCAALFACGANDYVGSKDCNVLAAVSERSWFLEICEQCQDKTCDAEGCSNTGFPYRDNKLVIVGCDEDSDCAYLQNARCGKHTAPRNICTTENDGI